MAKQLMFDETARAHLKNGLAQLAAAVKVTLGPTGRNVILHKSWGSPKVTKDGVSVSRDRAAGTVQKYGRKDGQSGRQ